MVKAISHKVAIGLISSAILCLAYLVSFIYCHRGEPVEATVHQTQGTVYFERIRQ